MAETVGSDCGNSVVRRRQAGIQQWHRLRRCGYFPRGRCRRHHQRPFIGGRGDFRSVYQRLARTAAAPLSDESRTFRGAELRTLLDQSAERLTETQTVLVELLSQGLGKPTRREGAKQRLTELAIEVFQDNARLALRLGGDHRIYQAHSEAMSVLHKAEAEQRTGGIDIALTDLDAFGDGVRAFMQGALELGGRVTSGRGSPG
jgi:hypothetical protein